MDAPIFPRTAAKRDEIRDWQARRAQVAERVRGIAASGACYQCEELRSEGGVLGEQSVITDSSRARSVLALDPRAPGHTIVVWKRHVQDFTELEDDEAAELLQLCRDVAKALKAALGGVERVYLISMCDGAINHLHMQLLPRYASSPIGSSRLVDERQPLLDAEEIVRAIRAALDSGG